MDFFEMLINDPVVYYSIIGLAVMAGISIFFVVYFKWIYFPTVHFYEGDDRG